MLFSFILILLAMAAYGALHSVLASHTVKRWACRKGGEAARRGYRFAYNIIVAVTLVPVLALMVLLPDAPLYMVLPPWRYAFDAVQALGLIGLLIGLLQTDLGAFSGLSQLGGKYDNLCSPDAIAPGGKLVTRGLYRWVRHPLYTSGLMFLWGNAVLTWNGLAFALGATAYIIIGAVLEERKLLAEFGQAYTEYMQRTPMLVPGLKFRRG